MLSYQSSPLPYLKSLSSLLDKVRMDGYTENFAVVKEGLYSLHTHQVYQPAEIRALNFFRFEGIQDPRERATMYIIETCDGLKGTLVKPSDKNADTGMEEFVVAVNKVRKHQKKMS